MGQLSGNVFLISGLGIGDLFFVSYEKIGCGYKNREEIISFKKELSFMFSKVNESF